MKPIKMNETLKRSRMLECGVKSLPAACSAKPYLNPVVGGAQLLHKPRPLINHLNDLVGFHQREGDVRPGMETHDLADRSMKREAGR